MFYSRYLPVHVKSKHECTVYTADKRFPAELLEQAYAFANNIESTSNNALMKEGVITFKSNPEFMWTLSEVVMAYEALQIARDCNFSYLPAYNKQGMPMLFISTRFNNARILVDAFTMRSVVVSKPSLVKKLSSMINGKFNDMYMLNFFKMVCAIESGRHTYLEGVIMDRYGDDPMLIVNPLMDINYENMYGYGLDCLEEYEQLVYNQVEETESFKTDGCHIYDKRFPKELPITVEYAHSLIELRDRLLEKKTDYIGMCDEDYKQYLYMSTNFRYLVNAATFECVTIENANLRDWIRSYAQNNTNPVSTLSQLWEMAVTAVPVDE